ncbi:ribosomal protein S18-alanine N-acetyltransferase [Corynebacterium pseudotuberculosis]|uniref:Ribosomal protein S18-alanine N-acetyltransferase n=1 Tax=Corynebacterium pseudotuberculosis 258 TaxID=1168865 RepID=A0AAU8PKE7_CORPS|nr:ribosomal protein S18-alanine N-acetyltransferase [Corynebacterium pseudotuberculosis]AER68506.1 Ribosomal-protein-alanine N-acetyltransferase [Corynebacterium pseudotuberculosis 1/06-A]AEQ05981.1 ribosomal protein S18-alanine N-acetyltransferase [Corynebacterium pseudotuberculosis CIP 52.97]AFB71759.1 ribosomal protein S18-alanine N-acetyltransferase [Corynebacterium pseudotuberculosis 316]AFH90258.1 ribosomal protein S18-alanine N-acetyltransferase [Corynebacterium pseudotuberculosis 31]A
MFLRELTAADAPRCAELETLLFSEENPWSVEDLRAAINHSHTLYIAVVDSLEKGLILGYAGLAMLGPAHDPEFEIHTIGVDPQFQRQGVARLMMDNITFVADRAAGPVFLEVRTTNEPAIRLYESYGFERQGVRKNYYQPSGADAYVMMRTPSAVESNEESGK